MAAPSSAHTRPSASASSAPTTQPNTACGPPIAATIKGMVMKGPIPHICVMLIATACPSVIRRWKPLVRVVSVATGASASTFGNLS